jgi:hypothetical protein
MRGVGNLKLRIRVPGWASKDVEFTVNGPSSPDGFVAAGKPGTYVTIEREWQDGDTVSFELPMEFRTVRYTGLDQHPEHPRYALLYGPILMALVGGTDLDIPVGELPDRLKPVDGPCSPDGPVVAGKPLHFSVDGNDAIYFMPYWQLPDAQAFTCFPTLR